MIKVLLLVSAGRREVEEAAADCITAAIHFTNFIGFLMDEDGRFNVIQAQ